MALRVGVFGVYRRCERLNRGQAFIFQKAVELIRIGILVCARQSIKAADPVTAKLLRAGNCKLCRQHQARAFRRVGPELGASGA